MTGETTQLPVVPDGSDELAKTMASDAVDILGFRIIRLLGSGGTADVYEAFQFSLNRRVAAKRIKSHLSQAREFVTLFREEGEKLGQLSHPNIVQVIDYHDETLTLFLEFIEGETYDRILERDGFPKAGQALEIVVEVLDGLEYAHKRRIAHLDIKPGNIFLTRDGHVKIADFGIAKILGAENEVIDAKPGWLGSPLFISPEQILHGNVDARADIYSTGVMLYFLIVRRPPFGGTKAELESRHINDRPVSPIDVDPGISPELNAIILRALEKAPENRFQSAADFRDALLALISPGQDRIYFEQAREEFDLAVRSVLLRRKTHLDNARKLADLALGENPGSGEATRFLKQIRKALALQRRQFLALALAGGGAAMAIVAAMAVLLVKAPGTLDIVALKPVDVILDGERLGTAPGRFQVGAGRHRLSYSLHGIMDFGGKDIVVQENKVLEENVNAPNVAEVFVSSEPQGAELKVDGVVQTRKLPFTFYLPWGRHTLEVGGVKKTVMVDRDRIKVLF